MNSEYLQYLPRVFKEGPKDETDFLGQYLKVFEALLSGREDAAIKDQEDNDVKVTCLEEFISRFENYLDAGLIPVEEFLTYLAKWVALVFDQNWPLEKKRQWLQKIVPLYKKRGTKSGLVEYLNMFVGREVKVEDSFSAFIVGEKSTVGVDTFINGAPPYYFRVKIYYGYKPDEFNYNDWKNLEKGIRPIIDLEKPAHTYYNLETRTPGIIINESSTVGKNTLIWKKSEKI